MTCPQFPHILQKAIIIVFLLLSFNGLSAEVLYVVNSQSRILSRLNTETDEVNISFATLGNVPNKIVVDSEYIWSVNSGDNAIQKISRQTGATLANILVEIGCNPWDAILHQDFLYITGLFTGKVYKLDTISGSVIGNVSVGTAPEALYVIGDKLYITNAGNYMQNYAGSSVSVIDLNSFTLIETIAVPANPQYLSSHNGMLHVSCTGNWQDIGGAICIIDPSTDTLVHTINLGGTPGCIWIANSSLALVADSSGEYMYSYNPDTMQLINGAENPLSNGGSEIVGNQSMIAILRPNWGGNATVNIFHSDLSPWKQFSVALMPTDLKMDAIITSNEDLIMQNQALLVYPNPVRQGAKIKFAGSSLQQYELSIYNLKGQKQSSYSYNGQKSISVDMNLPSGIYYYRVSDTTKGSKASIGKFMVLK